MKASKTMLSYVLATLVVCCLMPGAVFSDGPWDIDNGGGETNGGGDGNYDRTTATNSSRFDAGGDGTDGDGPSLVAAITYNWLYQAGFVRLADSIMIKDVERRVKNRRSISKPRR